MKPLSEMEGTGLICGINKEYYRNLHLLPRWQVDEKIAKVEGYNSHTRCFV
jgi:hypothetical protein